MPKPTVTFLWLTREKGRDANVVFWRNEPRKVSFSGGRRCRWTDGGYVGQALYLPWSRMNPELRLRKGQKIKVKRTSLKHGFKWQVVK